MGLDGYCQNELILYIIAIMKFIIKVLQIVTPIVVIVLVSFSFYNYIKDPNKGKSIVINRLKNGLISLLAIFLIPSAINGIMHNMTNGSYVSYCWDEADTEVNFNGAFLDDDKFIIEEESISGTINTSDLNEKQPEKNNNGSSSSSSYTANVTGDTKKLIEIAEEVWLSIVHGGYSYEAGSNHVPISPPYVDCSSYISTVLYNFGYTGFAGMQHHTKEFMEINWTDKYGWTEIPVAGGEDATNKVIPGDILVRTNPGGYGHVIFVVAVENGVVRAYDCGSASHWRQDEPIVVGNFIRDSRPGKIIRVT